MYNIYKIKKILGNILGIIILKIEPISRLRQHIFFEVNQFTGPFFQDLFNNEWTIPHRFGLSCSQGAFILVIDQDKISFRENTRMNHFIILGFYSLLMSLIYCGCISMLLIDMFQMKKAFFKTRCARMKFDC